MNTLAIGATGSGKSLAAVKVLFKLLSLVVLDPHKDSLAWQLMRARTSRGIEGGVIYDRLENQDHVAAWDMLSPTSSAIVRERIARAFADILIRRRGMTTLAGTPLIEEFLMAAIDCYMYQAKPVPLYALEHTYDTEHPVHHHLVQNCTNEDVKWRIHNLRYLTPTQRRNEVGGADRILKSAFRSPVFRARCIARRDVSEWLNRGGCFYMEGGNVSQNDKVITMGAMAQTVIEAARAGKFRRKVTLVIDEAHVLVGGYEAKALAELRKSNLDIVLITQSLTFPPEIAEEIVQNCGRIEVFRCNSYRTAKQAAEVLGTASLDPDEISHTDTTYRQVHDGYEEREGRFLGRYRGDFETREYRRSLSDQIRLTEKELLNLKVGERYVRQGSVWKEYVQPLEEVTPWPQLTDEETEEAIQRAIGAYGIVPSSRSWKPSPVPSGRSKKRSASRRGKQRRGGAGSSQARER